MCIRDRFWDHEGFALRQPAIAPRGEARDFTDIATDLAARCGLLEPYNAAINRGTLGVPLRDFSLATDKSFSSREIWDAVCKAASTELTGEAHGLDWWQEKGFATRPFPPGRTSPACGRRCSA